MRGTGSATDLSKSIYSLKQQDGEVFKFVSDKMKMDEAIVLAVLRQVL